MSDTGRVKTFRLVDKEGWLASWGNNVNSLHCFDKGVVTLQDDDGSDCWYPVDENSWKSNSIIGEGEMQFFEEITSVLEDESPTEPHLWDGKEELEVGMVALARYNHDSKTVTHTGEVLYLSDKRVIMNLDGIEWHGLLGDYILESPLLKPEDVFAKKMLEKARSHSLANAHDTEWDIVELSKMCYKELMDVK